jgi:hypothetical protein
MNLELKHITPYFNHGLFIYSEEYDEIFRINQINKFGDFKLWIHNSDEYNKIYLNRENLTGLGFKLNKIKPILKPLSELLTNKEDLDNITPYSLHFIENNLEIEEFVNLSENGMVDQVLYSDVEYLLSKHYDIYNLILNNLALDKNNL